MALDQRQRHRRRRRVGAAPAADVSGESFAAYSPDDRYLLAMKLFAARGRDFDDAVRLSIETGITFAEAMLELLDDAYYHNVVPRGDEVLRRGGGQRRRRMRPRRRARRRR